jgi:hypothetical protein
MLSTWEKVKETMLLLPLNIILPSADVYSDLYLIAKFIIRGHTFFAGLLLVPFALNYLLTWGVWWRLDKSKKVSWIAVALACYPQFRAVEVIILLWRDSEKGLAKKRALEREVVEYEVFAESAITAVVMTCLMMEVISRPTSVFTSEFKIVIGEDSLEIYMFFFTFATSILSTSFGLAKCLKVGPCHILAEGGLLGGLFTCRFMTLLISTGVTLISKGSTLSKGLQQVSRLQDLLFAFSTMFLPGLIIAIMSLFHNKDWNKIIKSIISHPSLLLLPVFTHYTFSANRKSFCSRREEGHVDVPREDLHQILIIVYFAIKSQIIP